MSNIILFFWINVQGYIVIDWKWIPLLLTLERVVEDDIYNI